MEGTVCYYKFYKEQMFVSKEQAQDGISDYR